MMKRIRFWIIAVLTSLVVLVGGLISIFFYNEFSKSLDERVLLQLTSIQNLKGIQINRYIKEEWSSFNLNKEKFILTDQEQLKEIFDKDCIENRCNTTGIYDITECHIEKQTHIAFFIKNDSLAFLKIINGDEIKKILMERTGMGQSGETYLVAEDHRLRSESRFFPDSIPFFISTNSSGVNQALNNNSGSGIIKDYRNVEVYSSYALLDNIDLNWVILSEIDVEEGTMPLKRMQKHLFVIFSSVIMIAVLLSFILSKIMSRPLLRVRDQLNIMSHGNYLSSLDIGLAPQEVYEMMHALENLKKSILGAIDFSENLGEMNLHSSYEITGDEDVLGKSLLKMQEKLLEFQMIESSRRKNAQRMLLKGQEDERERLSRELHDGIGPLLTGLRFLFQTDKYPKKSRERAIQLIDKTIDEVRRITYALMPPAIKDFGVGKALISFTQLIQQATNIDLKYNDSTLEDNSKISNDLGVNIFRVVQELINNTIKHAEASSIRISLTEFENHCSLYYFDNGKGFDPESDAKGAGINNIKERLQAFNGRIVIRSSEEGTTVEIEIPI
jgi:signal transduction histidine kinase